jgi:Na+/H+ antiporter NhaB
MLTRWLAVVAAMPAISLAEVVVLEGVAVGVAEEVVVAGNHQQDQQGATMTIEPPVRFVVRATMMHCSVGTALTKLIKQRISSNKKL